MNVNKENIRFCWLKDSKIVWNKKEADFITELCEQKGYRVATFESNRRAYQRVGSARTLKKFFEFSGTKHSVLCDVFLIKRLKKATSRLSHLFKTILIIEMMPS